MSSPDPSVPLHASEEAIHEFYNNWKHWPASRPDSWPDEVERDKERTAKLNADFLSDIREFVDRVSRERTRQAMERAAKVAEAERTYVTAPGRPSAPERIAAAIRALAPQGGAGERG